MIEAELPDGTILEFPDGTPNDVVQRAVRQRLGTPAQEPRSVLQRTRAAIREGVKGIPQQLGNVAAGAVRGAGSIGATLLSPVDAAARAMGIENDIIGRTDRREAMTEGLRSLGANPDSVGFTLGKIGGEVAGTAGIGGVLGRAAQAARWPVTGERIPAALAQAIGSSGMSAGGLTGARGLATRAAGGAVTGAAAAGMVNPEDAGTGAAIGGALPLATAGLRAAGSGLMNTLGVSTGTGREAMQTAFEAGRQGGARGAAFTGQLRREQDMLGVLDDARANLAKLRQDRAAAYRSNMAAVQADKAVLDMTPIENAVQESINNFTFKGQAKNPDVLNTLSRVRERVQNWRNLDPVEHHTPEGLDALKQQIGAIRESLPNEARSSRAALDNVYASIKRQIESQAPNYAKAMKDYEEASDLIDEISRTFSLRDVPRATVDTAMRKLQSVMRNNVQTNYGVRTSLLEQMEQQGGRELMPALAGQALSEWYPRGLQRVGAPAVAAGVGYGTGNLPLAATVAATSSPRLMGEMMYGAGQASRFIEPLRRPLYSVAPVLGAQ